MKNYKRLNVENGFYLFKLKQILEDKNLSINKIMKDTNTDFKVLKRIMNGDLVRIDIFVLARLCDYLDCKISDILEYFPNQESKQVDWTKSIYL